MSENKCEKDNREPQAISQGKFYAFCERKGIMFEKRRKKKMNFEKLY